MANFSTAPDHPAGRAIRFGLVGVGALLLYLLFWPIEAEPGVWHPPPTPDPPGAAELVRRAGPVEKILLGGARGPEDIAFDRQNRLYTGVEDGRILRLDAPGEGASAELFAVTGGRPRGLTFARGGELLVADLERGLLSISPGGEIRVLATHAAGRALGRTNGVTAGSDGTIYFTDASPRWPRGSPLRPLLENLPTGRLLALDPETGRVRVLVDSLRFANGVTLSREEDFILVAETAGYRIRRLWLRGERAGESELFRENLPGLPDGLSTDPDGTFRVALATPRSALLDRLMPHPFLRKILLRIPERLLPEPPRQGAILLLDEEGRTVESLQRPDGEYGPVTSVVRRGEWLYLGSSREAAVGRIRIPLAGELDR